ncbi:uncharacterized protein LOC143346092 [Colletes latitarsis]|uniref:uncharacterized protein LOC143346092 n=1 Tax=Colletes latitarsis TaxID=2605962 RepID=UPI0040353098
MAVHSSLLIYSIYQINLTDFQVDLISTRVHCNIIMGLGFMNICSGYASSRSKLKVLQRVFNLARSLSSEIFYKTAKWTLLNDTIKYLPLFLFLQFIFMGKVIVNFAVWYSFVVTATLNSLYVSNVRVVKASFWEINESLVKLRETLINDEPHLLRRVYHTQKNSMLLAEVRTLKRQHLEISAVVQLINQVFSEEVIGTIALTLVDITFNLYSCLVIENSKAAKLWSFQFLCVTFYFLNLIVMVWICESAMDQAKKVVSNIHRILITIFDEKLTTELELFSVQVLQQDNTFSAKGLMIDATLLTKVVSTVTTYLLILIQFLLVKPC